MTGNTKWAVTVHRKNGEKSSTAPLHHAESAQAAISAVAHNLDLKIDDEGYVIGDKEISRLTAVAAPNAPEHQAL
jgi:hypothetical protein